MLMRSRRSQRQAKENLEKVEGTTRRHFRRHLLQPIVDAAPALEAGGYCRGERAYLNCDFVIDRSVLA
jgi:hypothetical protein